jgi:PIN domain nuclease of toxin-antitoxin system
MKLLLDTHAFLWWQANDRRLPKHVRRAISEARIVFVSAATAWEAAIKSALGRLEYPDTIESGVEAGGFDELPFTITHAEHAARLAPHHHDPFDRMLIAQAQVEDLTLVTNDRGIARYDVALLW